MPKEQTHIADAQRQRKRIREKFSKYVPGRITLQVLGTGAEGAPRSLYVFSDQSRYLFNCGEGTQRLAHEHKMKLAKLEHIFITQRTWRNVGGLPGTALTIQDVGVPHITLHGPKGLEELFTATKRFVIIRDLQIEMADCSETNVFEDNVMTVKYVPIKKTPSVETIVTTVYDTLQQENGRHTSIINNQGIDQCKGIQAACDVVEVATSTRTERNRHHSRRNSRSCSPAARNEEVVEDDIDYYAHERKTPLTIVLPKHKPRTRSDSGRRVAPEKVTESSRLLPLKEMKEEGTSMCYICKLQPRPGALNLEKCVKYGVPPGPLLGKLKMGQDVMLPSGVIIKSIEVCEPDDPGPVFLVVDCPSDDYLDSFVNNPAFKKHQITAKNNENLAYLVVHFTPQGVLESSRYREWVDQFSPSTHHLILNECNTCMGSISVHRVQHKLNLLHNTIFPLLGDEGTKTDLEKKAEPVPSLKRMKTELKVGQSDTGSKNSQSVDSELDNLKVHSRSVSPCDSFTYANTFCNFHLRPRKGLDRSSELILTPTQYVEETMNEEGFAKTLKELQYLIKSKTQEMKIRPYPRLLFLGTGSCIPNKTRNTSGILLEASENTNIIIDCGEGTYGQIVRFFGPDKADQVLAKIKGIFVSHLHADHHIGLIGLLQGRRRALNRLNRYNCPPVLLLAPKQILAWLNFYDKYFESICKEFELVPNADLIQDEQTLFEGTKVRVYLTLEMSDINTAYVRHCPNAYGIAFTHRNGYKICYSGDTMPAENLINVGLNCDLLIHEATMEDELEHEAVMKMHSTTSQAIEVGRNMNARHILLTHFSQRYAKLPRFNDNFGDNVGIAFDNMQIRLDELPLVPLLYPALKLMFAEHYEELECKAVKRQLKQELRDDRSSIQSYRDEASSSHASVSVSSRAASPFSQGRASSATSQGRASSPPSRGRVSSPTSQSRTYSPSPQGRTSTPGTNKRKSSTSGSPDSRGSSPTSGRKDSSPNGSRNSSRGR